MFALLILIVVIVIIVFAAVLFIIQTRRGNAKPINPDNCDVALDTVPNISGIECCYVNNEATQFKYYEPFDAVLGPNPVYWVQACSGFCEDDKVSSDKLSCEKGSSQKYQRCVQLTRPVNCKGTAKPVAADGIRLFYVNSATSSMCQCFGNCDGSSSCTDN